MFVPGGASRPLIRFPWVALGIAALCCSVHLVKNVLFDVGEFHLRFGFLSGLPSLATLFSHQFIHGDIWHLVGNLFFFAIAGLKMEDALGHLKFLLFYLLGGFAAAGCQAALEADPTIPLIGASGAIAAVLGGFSILHPHVRLRLMFLGIWRVAWEPPAWFFLGFWFANELRKMVFDDGSSVAFAAHVGGFAFGAFLMWGFFGWNKGEDLDMRALGETAEVVYDVQDQQDGEEEA